MAEKYKKSKQTVDKLVDVTCDRCLKSCMDEINMNLEYAEMKAEWGYGSKKDCEKHKIQLCEKCYDETLKVMKITPLIQHYM